MKKIQATECCRFILIYLTFFISSSNCTSQSTFNLSNESIAQGCTGVATKSISSLYSNPAGSTTIKDYSLTANYFMPYFIQELSNQSLALIIPTKYGNTYGIIDRNGYKLYNENRLTIGFAKNISPLISLSFQLNLQHNQIMESGNGQQLFSCIGIQFNPHSSVTIGFFAFNPEKASIKINTYREDIASYVNLGIKWQPYSNFSISSEINKTINYNTITRFGLEYTINQILITRIGVYGKPLVYTLGMGLKIESLTFDIAMTNHQNLGISSGLGISYKFPSKK